MFFVVSEKVRTQLNVENLLDQGYFLNADNNNNITPGGPRAVRVSFSTRF
jgi:catecholate siderophore receptor